MLTPDQLMPYLNLNHPPAVLTFEDEMAIERALEAAHTDLGPGDTDPDW